MPNADGTPTADELAREASKLFAGNGNGKEDGMLGGLLGFFKLIIEALVGIGKKDDKTPAADTNTETEIQHTPSTGKGLKVGKQEITAECEAKMKTYLEAHQGEAVSFINPVEGNAKVTSVVGKRKAPRDKKGRIVGSTNHAGIDMVAQGSDRILAAEDGLVIFSKSAGGSGNTVIIGHADGTFTVYRHMTGANMPALGSEVQQGDVIGQMGSTGNSTGKHLHFELRTAQNVAVTPRIEGESLTKGSIVDAHNHNHEYASLVNPKTMQKLPVADSNATSYVAPGGGSRQATLTK